MRKLTLMLFVFSQRFIVLFNFCCFLILSIVYLLCSLFSLSSILTFSKYALYPVFEIYCTFQFQVCVPPFSFAIFVLLCRCIIGHSFVHRFHCILFRILCCLLGQGYILSCNIFGFFTIARIAIVQIWMRCAITFLGKLLFIYIVVILFVTFVEFLVTYVQYSHDETFSCVANLGFWL